MRKEVKNFADKMEQKLKKNDFKENWQNCSQDWLLNKLISEVGEYADWLLKYKHCLFKFKHEEVNFVKILEEGIQECVDIANISMMIADNFQRDKKKY